jgi:hypothetical protein
MGKQNNNCVYLDHVYFDLLSTNSFRYGIIIFKPKGAI